MQIEKGSNPTRAILQREAGKKVGKLSMNWHKFDDTGALKLHRGHRRCLTALNKCDIKVVEFVNIDALGMRTLHNPMAPEKVLEKAAVASLGVDYVIYNSADIASPSQATKDLVDQRIEDEGYIWKLNMPDPVQFAKNLYWITNRGDTDFTAVRSWKTGTENFGYKHYVEKYLNIDTIVIEPSYYPSTKVPLSGLVKLDHLPEEYREQCEAFYENPTSFSDYPYYTELSDPEFVPNGKTFVACHYITDRINLPLCCRYL